MTLALSRTLSCTEDYFICKKIASLLTDSPSIKFHRLVLEFSSHHLRTCDHCTKQASTQSHDIDDNRIRKKRIKSLLADRELRDQKDKGIAHFVNAH